MIARPDKAPHAAPVRSQARCWTCGEFHDLCDSGAREGRNDILVAGEVLELPPSNPPHNTALSLADYLLKALFSPGFHVRVQMALDLDLDTDPVPDIGVVAGSVRDYGATQPTTAALVVEVSDSTISYDRGDKASLYAAGGIADYWVLDIGARQLLVFREPKPDPLETHGFGYAQRTASLDGQSVVPLAASHISIAGSDVLP